MTKNKRTRSRAPARIKRGGKTFYRSRRTGFGGHTEANNYAQKRVAKGKEVRIIHLKIKKMGMPSQTKPYFVYERNAWWKEKR